MYVHCNGSLLGTIYRNDDTTDFPIRIGMLDNSKARWEKNSYSRNELAAEDRRDFKNTKNKKRWHIRQSLVIQTTLLDKVVQRRLRWFGHRRDNSSWQNPTRACRTKLTIDTVTIFWRIKLRMRSKFEYFQTSEILLGTKLLESRSNSRDGALKFWPDPVSSNLTLNPSLA